MEDKNLALLLEEQGFTYVPHRGTTDIFIKDDIEIKIPYISIIKNGITTHMIPAYKIGRINEVINE